LLRDGIGEERLLQGLWWAQFWEGASQDSELIRLEAEQEKVFRTSIEKSHRARTQPPTARLKPQ
jgi:hypothetical protein